MLSTIICFLAFAFIPADDLRKQIEAIARTVQGRVGVAVMVLETGKTVEFAADQKFPMQSVYKFPIGMAVLAEVDRGALRLDQKVMVSPDDLAPKGLHSPIRDAHPNGNVELTIQELLRFMVSESDGTACDVLLRVAGGPGKVTDFLQRVGTFGIIVATSEKEMSRNEQVQYRNSAMPKSMVALLKALHEGRKLSPASRGLLLQLMTDTPTGVNRIKGQLPAGTIVAHKTGTSGTENGLTRATNDVGIVTLPNGNHLAIAVFVADSKAEREIREGVIARIARAAWDWAQPAN